MAGKDRGDKKAIFVLALRDGHSVKKAAEAAGVTRATCYRWRADDPHFEFDWDEAVEEGTDTLEDEAMRRARDGVDKPVYYQGKEVGTIKEYSDTLLIFMLKARRRQKFGDQAVITNTNARISDAPQEKTADEWESEYCMEPTSRPPESLN